MKTILATLIGILGLLNSVLANDLSLRPSTVNLICNDENRNTFTFKFKENENTGTAELFIDLGGFTNSGYIADGKDLNLGNIIIESTQPSSFEVIYNMTGANSLAAKIYYSAKPYSPKKPSTVTYKKIKREVFCNIQFKE